MQPDREPADDLDYQQAARVATNALMLFYITHPGINAADWRIVFLLDDRGELRADVLPTDRFYRESLN